MSRRDTVTAALTSAGGDVEERMRRAVNAILDLVWDARSDKFAFADNEDIDAETNHILAMMSEGLFDEAHQAAKALLRTVEMDEWEDDALGYAEGNVGGEDALFRFDMQASHLKELLESWIVVAAIYGLSRQRVWSDLVAYLSNPLASRMWRGAGRPMLHWGKGYVTNLIAAYKRLIRDFMARAYHYAEMKDYARKGATGYTIHRGSFYDCPLCDSYTGQVYPLSVVILPNHPNCMCYTEPYFEETE